jgi:hypothetical protein
MKAGEVEEVEEEEVAVVASARRVSQRHPR